MDKQPTGSSPFLLDALALVETLDDASCARLYAALNAAHLAYLAVEEGPDSPADVALQAWVDMQGRVLITKRRRRLRS